MGVRIHEFSQKWIGHEFSQKWIGLKRMNPGLEGSNMDEVGFTGWVHE